MQDTIHELSAYGVTERLICEHWQPSEATSDWSEFEKDALVFLVTGIPPKPIIMQDYTITPLPKHLCLKPQQALQEITKLCDSRLQALIRFYQKGLRGQQLRDWRGKSLSGFNVFTHSHYLALETLIDKKNRTPKKAVELITNVDSETATKIWLDLKYTEVKHSFKVEKQQKLAKLRLRNHYLPESFSIKLFNLRDNEGNLLGIYESEYSDLKSYLKKQGKNIEQLSVDEWYKAVYESKVKVVKYFNPQALKSYELDMENSQIKKGKIISKGGIQLYNDGQQNLIAIKDSKVYISPKIRPIPGDISPTQAFKSSEEKPGLVGICHSSLTSGEIVEFAGSLFYNKELG